MSDERKVKVLMVMVLKSSDLDDEQDRHLSRCVAVRAPLGLVDQLMTEEGVAVDVGPQDTDQMSYAKAAKALREDMGR